MRDEDKTKEQLLTDLIELRQQLAGFSKQDSLNRESEIIQEKQLIDQDLIDSGQYITEQNYEIIDYLKNCRLFSHLPETLIRQLIPLSELSEYPAGTEILREGQANDRVFFIIRGEVEVYAGGHLIINLRRQGDIFGEMSIISDKPVSASVITKTPVKTFSIKGRDIGNYTDIDTDALHNTLYRIFAMIMTDKLSMTTDKAKQFEIAEKNLLKEISDREQTEKVLRESERRLNKAQSVAKIGSWEYDIDDGVFWGSEQAFEIFGIERDSPYVPRKVVESNIVDIQKFRRALSDLILHNKSYNIEFEIHKDDGQIVIVRSIAELVWEDDIKKKVIGVVQDITEQKKTSEEKKALENQLFQAQKLDAVGILASGIAHDFNNLLSVFFSFSDLTIKKLSDSPEYSKIVQYQTTIRKAADRAENLINQILTFSRTGGYDPKNINLIPIINESMKFLRSAIPTTITISHSVDPDLKNIHGDHTQIQQVLVNLCTNASHAMEHEGGELEVNVSNFKIDTKSNETGNLEPGDYVLLSVSDTGEGIDQKIMDRIFDPFFTTKKSGKGTGLGLSVVHGIITQHGGTVQVNSSPGIGTRFNVLLPASADHKAETPDKQDEILPRGSEYILIVDDEEMILNSYAEMLEMQGYRVNQASSGAQALDEFKKNADRIDLVITDYSMPKMSGVDLCTQIQKIKKDVPIILISGLAHQVSDEEFVSAGINARFKKPIGFEKLVREVRDILDKKVK
ncbi:response regulator [bacterium]|nr:response regulator [bacterium]